VGGLEFLFGWLAYSYLANSPLVEQITFQQSEETRMTTSKSYDY
jgi:hypothetical protein